MARQCIARRLRYLTDIQMAGVVLRARHPIRVSGRCVSISETGVGCYLNVTVSAGELVRLDLPRPMLRFEPWPRFARIRRLLRAEVHRVNLGRPRCNYQVLQATPDQGGRGLMKRIWNDPSANDIAAYAVILAACTQYEIWQPAGAMARGNRHCSWDHPDTDESRGDPYLWIPRLTSLRLEFRCSAKA